MVIARRAELTTGLPSIVFIAFLIALMHLSQCIPTLSSTTCAQRWLSDKFLELSISAYIQAWMHDVLLDSSSSGNKQKSRLQLTAMVPGEQSRRLMCTKSSNSFLTEDVHLSASWSIYRRIRTFLFHASNCNFCSPPWNIKHALYNSSWGQAFHTQKGALQTTKGNIG